MKKYILIFFFITFNLTAQNDFSTFFDDMCQEFSKAIKNKESLNILEIAEVLQKEHQQTSDSIMQSIKKNYNPKSDNQLLKYFTIYATFYMVDNCTEVEKSIESISGKKTQPNEFLLFIEKEAEKLFDKCLSIDCDNFSLIEEEYIELLMNYFFKDKKLREEIYGDDLFQATIDLEAYMPYNKKRYKILMGTFIEEMFNGL